MIVYDPAKIIRKLAPEKQLKKLVGNNVSLKKTALRFVDASEVVSKKSVRKVALKTIKSYKDRIKLDPSIKEEILKNPRQLIQRVQNEVVLQVSNEIKTKYRGEFYIWLPSDADEPDPEHQLNYGKKFQIGDGEMPGERYGCRCGMQIITEDSTLEL